MIPGNPTDNNKVLNWDYEKRPWKKLVLQSRVLPNLSWLILMQLLILRQLKNENKKDKC